VHFGPGTDRLEVIAIKGDIQRAPAQRTPELRFDEYGQAIRQLHAASLDAHEHQVAAAGCLHNELRRHARKYAPHGGGVEKARR
jgi:hypothetical protein